MELKYWIRQILCQFQKMTVIMMNQAKAKISSLDQEIT